MQGGSHAAGEDRAEGRGEVYERHWKFKEGSLTGGRYDFMVGDIPYLSGPPLHVHYEQDDTFFVLDGVLTVQVGDELFELGPGDFATVPLGIPHTFDNVKKDQLPVKVCNLMTPGGLDALFRDLGPGTPDPARMAAVGKKNGVDLVGPTLGVKLGLA